MKHFWIAALCAAGLSYASILNAQTSNPVVWRFATGYRAESFHTENLMQFGQAVERATKNQLHIDVAPNGSLFKLNEIRQAVQEGKIEAGETIMTSMDRDIPIAGADSIPFVVSSFKLAQRLWDLQRPSMEREFAQRGLRILYAVPWPPQGLFSTRPVSTLGDFKNLKMRTYNQTTVRLAEMLGATPVDVAMVDVGKAVSSGRMDTMITSALTGVENKVWGPIKYYYDISAWYPKNIVFVSTRSFEALSPDNRAAVLKAAADAESRGWLTSEFIAQTSIKELQANGVKVERISPDLEVGFKRLGLRFSREWVRTVGNQASAIFVPYYFN